MPSTRRKSPRKDALVESKPDTIAKKVLRVRSSSSRWPSIFKVIAGSSGLAVLPLLLKTFKKTSVAPVSYAICSRDYPAIYTVDNENAVVQCIVIHNSRILDTGSLNDISVRWSQRGSGDQIWMTFQESLEIRYIPSEAIIVPGMTDSHCHTLEYGASKILPLDGPTDISAVVSRVKDYVISDPSILANISRFIEGWGWDHTTWPVGEAPSYGMLEAEPVLRGRPIVLQSKDGHAQWVSEAILKGMLPLPDYVDGGIIVRDSEGRPTGVFMDKAQDLVKRPRLTHNDNLIRYKLAVGDALSKGLTSLHDAGFDPATMDFYDKQSQVETLPIRIYGMAHFNESAEYWGNTRDKIFDRNRLTARSVKIFADGALRSGGAALFEPYADNPESNGFMRIDPAVLFEFVPKFIGDGWQVNIHAIGDRANSIVLDALESSFVDGAAFSGSPEVRLRIEHAQIIRPEDAVRLARLGVIASVQPTHVVSDMWFAEDRLGPERVKNLYAFRTIIDAGARITLGSDFPVEDMNPLAGFHAAVTRVSPEGESPHGSEGWFPNQRLTRIEALRGITIDPAYASFSEDSLGSLEPGKLADFVVLSQNIMTVHENIIKDTKVLATVIDGALVYGQM